VDAAFAELTFSPGGPAGRWHVSALGNYIDTDQPVVSLRLGEQSVAPGFLSRHVTGGLGAHFLMRRNVRLVGEGQRDLESDQTRLVTGFSLAF